MIEIPKESEEYLPLTITRNGATLVDPTNISYAILLRYNDPDAGEWEAALEVDDRIVALVEPVTVKAIFRVWARVIEGSEDVVLLLGEIERF